MANATVDVIAPKQIIVPTIKIDGTETPTLSGSLVISGAEAYVAFDGGLKQITN